MVPAFKDLTVTFKDSPDKLTEEWKWLIGADKTPIIISAIGDMFLIDKLGQIYWLDVGGGVLKLVAKEQAEFEKKLTDIEQVNEWFMIDLLTDLRVSATLKEGQLYSYRKLPIIGGEYSAINFAPLDIKEHFGCWGEVHRQIKDLPDGTQVRVTVVP